MAKKDHKPVLATPEQRELASLITHGRRYMKEWKEQTDKAVDELRASLDGEVNITLVTETNDEVADIGETVLEGYDYNAFFTAYPHLKVELERFKKDPTVSTRVTTKWIERPPQQ